MKIYFRQLMQFSFICIPGYFIFLILWGSIPYSHNGSNLKYKQGSYGHLNTRVKEILDYGEVDILFVGSSRVYRGFDPRKFEEHGIKVFVLGSSGQSPIQSYMLLKRYVKELNPKLVVFDLFPKAFSKKGIESSIDLLANDQMDSLNWNMALLQNDILVWNTLLYAKFRHLLGLHNGYKEKRYKPGRGDMYISGGYVHKELKYNKSVECGNEKSLWQEPIRLQIDHYNKITRMLRELDIDIQLINMPIANYDCYSNNDILEPLWEGSNLDYVDFNKELTWRDSVDFYDNFHLNEKGVEKLNSFFIDHFIESQSNDF